MENTVDALKMAGAAILFVLAFTIAIMLISKSRETEENILDSLRLKEFFPQVQALEDQTTREVGIETIIPTLYRYCQSDGSLRIRILDVDGTELEVFDTGIEAIVRRDPDLNNPYEREINEKYNTRGESAYMFEAPWEGQNQETYRLERVNAFIAGTRAKHMENVDYSASNAYNKTNLMRFSNRIFQESYLEYRTSGQVYTDDYGEEIVTIPASLKTIITYKLTNKMF